MTRSQFPNPWRPLEGSYERSHDSRRWRFSGRDAGDSAAFAAVIQPVVMSAVAWLEWKANQNGGGLNAGEAGAAYMSIFSLAMVCKVAARVLKQYGTSMIHDVGAWIWERFIEPFFVWLIDAISQLFPGHHRRVRRRDRWNEHLDDDTKPRREGLWRRWRQRRNRGDR